MLVIPSVRAKLHERLSTQQNSSLAAIEQGKDINEFRKFLLARCSDSLPDTVTHLLSDIIKRATQLQDKGKVSLIECADASLAESIANDSRCKKYYMRAGNCYLVVHAGREKQFRKALRQLGYCMPAS